MHPRKLSQSGTEAPPLPCPTCGSASTSTTTTTTAAAGAATTTKHARPARLSPRVGASATGAAATGTHRPHGIAALHTTAAAPTKSGPSSCRTTPRKALAPSGAATAAGNASTHATPRSQRPGEAPPLAGPCSSSSTGNSAGGVVNAGHGVKGHPGRCSTLSQTGTPQEAALPVTRRAQQPRTPRVTKKSPTAGRTTPRTGQSPAPPPRPPSTSPNARCGDAGTSDDEETNEPFAEVPRQTPRTPTPRRNAATAAPEPDSGVVLSPSPTPRTPAADLHDAAASPPPAAPALTTPAPAQPQPQPPPLPLYRVVAAASGASGVSLMSTRRSTPCVGAAASRVSPTARRTSLSEPHAPALVESTASLSLSLELLPSAALQLPPCTDPHLQRLFEVLLPHCGDSVWDVHEHVLPFLAARQHAIMPVTPARLACFVRLTNEHAEGDAGDAPVDALGGDDADVSRTMPVEGLPYGKDGTSHVGPAAPPAPRTRFTATALTRFASQVCSWFLLMGHLSTGDATRWESVLSLAPSAPPASVTPRAPSRTSWGQHERRTSAAAPRSGVNSAGPDTPEKQPRRRSRVSRRSFADNVERDTAHDGAGSGTVEWQTERLERSPLDTTLGSTQGSLDFHVVVEAPPRVDAAAFRRGFNAVQALLSDRAAQLAALKPGPLRTALMAVCTTTQTDTAATSSELRALSRRVRFYLRLHAFLRELCVALCAREQRPWQRESQLIESAIAARLAATTPTMQGNVRGLTRTLQAAAKAGPTDVSPNALDTLLVLSHAEATRTMQRATDTSHPAASVDTDSAPLPAALLLLFPAPRWSSPSWPAAPSLLRIAAAWRLATLLTAALLGYGLLFRIPVEWGEALAMMALPMPDAVCASRAVDSSDHPPPDPAWMLLGCGGLLALWLGGVAAHRTGAALATAEVRQATARQHAAALAAAARGWLVAAVAAQAESDLAAHAVQHGLRCLQMAQDSVDAVAAATAVSTAAGSWSRGPGLAAVGLLALTAMQLVGVAVPPALRSRAGLLLLLGLQTCAVITMRFVEARRHHHRALEWWVRCQAATAEGAAEELVSCLRHGSQSAADGAAAATAGGGGGGGERDVGFLIEREEPRSLGGTYTARTSPAPSSATLAALRALREVPLPLLEEWAKVACLVAWCAQSSSASPRRSGSAPSIAARRGTPASGPALAERAFWAVLCGHVAPAYMRHASATDVVEKTMRGCWKRLEAAPTTCASVAELIARTLPWTTDAHEGCVDEQLTDVLAPLSGGGTRHGPAPGRSCSAVQDAAAAAPLEVEGRRQPYLSQAQWRLVVASAFVFTVLRAAPRELLAPRRRSAARADGITPRNVSLLEHLVRTELHAPHPAGAELWRGREAATRTQAALQLLQRRVVSAPFFEARATRPALLPPLLETLFR